MFRRVFRSRSSLLAFALAVLSVVLLVASVLPGFFTSPTGAEEAEPNPLQDFVYAVAYLDLSAKCLDNASHGLFYSCPPKGAILNLTKKISMYRLGYGVPPGSIGIRVAKAANEYLNISVASYNITESLDYIPIALRSLRNALGNLSICRIGDAIESYESGGRAINMSIALLGDAIIHLYSVNTSNLLSHNHSRVVEYAEGVTEDVFKSLYQASKLMQIVKRYRSIFESLCRLNRLNRSVALDQSTCQCIGNNLGSVKPEGVLAIEIADALTNLEQLLSSAGASSSQSMPGGSQQGQGSGGGVVTGGGAGYVSP